MSVYIMSMSRQSPSSVWRKISSCFVINPSSPSFRFWPPSHVHTHYVYFYLQTETSDWADGSVVTREEIFPRNYASSYPDVFVMFTLIVVSQRCSSLSLNDGRIDNEHIAIATLVGVTEALLSLRDQPILPLPPLVPLLALLEYSPHLALYWLQEENIPLHIHMLHPFIHTISIHTYYIHSYMLYPFIHATSIHTYYIHSYILYPFIHYYIHSYILHPFIHTTSIHTYYIHSYMLHPFIHTTSIHTYYIHSYILHPFIHATSIHTYYIHSYILHPFIHATSTRPWISRW
jgi:hypothetical protein